MTGTIIRYDRTKGYGFILPDDQTQPDCFVIAKSILEPRGRRWLLAGWRVDYTVIETDRGPQAQDVKVIQHTIARQTSSNSGVL
jgi:CspA family cold shock protein